MYTDFCNNMRTKVSLRSKRFAYNIRLVSGMVAEHTDLEVTRWMLVTSNIVS